MGWKRLDEETEEGKDKHPLSLVVQLGGKRGITRGRGKGDFPLDLLDSPEGGRKGETPMKDDDGFRAKRKEKRGSLLYSQ